MFENFFVGKDEDVLKEPPQEGRRGGGGKRKGHGADRVRGGKRLIAEDGPVEVPTGMEAAMMEATGAETPAAAAAAIETVEKPKEPEVPAVEAAAPEVVEKAVDAQAELEAELNGDSEPAPAMVEAVEAVATPEKKPAPEKKAEALEVPAAAKEPEAETEEKGVTAPPPPPAPKKVTPKATVKKATPKNTKMPKASAPADGDGWTKYEKSNPEVAEKRAKVLARDVTRGNAAANEGAQKVAMEAQPDESKEFAKKHEALESVKSDLEALKKRSNAHFVEGLPEHEKLMRSLKKVEPLLTGEWEEDPKVATHLANTETARVQENLKALEAAVEKKQAELWSGTAETSDLGPKKVEAKPKKSGWWNRTEDGKPVPAEVVKEESEEKVPEKEGEVQEVSPETQAFVADMRESMKDTRELLRKRAKRTKTTFKTAKESEESSFDQSEKKVKAVSRRIDALEKSGEPVSEEEQEALRTELAQAVWEMRKELKAEAVRGEKIEVNEDRTLAKDAETVAEEKKDEAPAEVEEVAEEAIEDLPEDELTADKLYDSIREDVKVASEKIQDLTASYPELKDDPRYPQFTAQLERLQEIMGSDGEKPATPFAALASRDSIKRQLGEFEKIASKSELDMDLAEADEKTVAARGANAELAKDGTKEDMLPDEDGENLFGWGEKNSVEAESAKIEHVAGRIATLLEKEPELQGTEEYKAAYAQYNELKENAGNVTLAMEEEMQDKMMQLRKKAIALASGEGEEAPEKMERLILTEDMRVPDAQIAIEQELAAMTGDPRADEFDFKTESDDQVAVEADDSSEAAEENAATASDAEGAVTEESAPSGEDVPPAGDEEVATVVSEEDRQETGTEVASEVEGGEAAVLAAAAAVVETGVNDSEAAAEDDSGDVESEQWQEKSAEVGKLFGMEAPKAGPDGWIGAGTFLAGLKFAVAHQPELMSDPKQQQMINEIRIILEDLPKERGLTQEQADRVQEVIKEIAQPERVFKQKFAKVDEMYAEAERKIKEKLSADLDAKTDTRKVKGNLGLATLLTRLSGRNKS